MMMIMLLLLLLGCEQIRKRLKKSWESKPKMLSWTDGAINYKSSLCLVLDTSAMYMGAGVGGSCCK